MTAKQQLFNGHSSFNSHLMYTKKKKVFCIVLQFIQQSKNK